MSVAEENGPPDRFVAVLARRALLAGDHDRAGEYVNAEHTPVPTRLVALARLSLAQADAPAAAAALEQAAQMSTGAASPTAAWALGQLAVLQFLQEDPRSAATAQSMIQVYHKDERAAGEAYVQVCRYNLYSSQVQDAQDAIARATRSLSFRIDGAFRARVHGLRAEVLLRLGRPEEGAAAADEAVGHALYARDEKAIVREVTRALAIHLIDRGEPDSALLLASWLGVLWTADRPPAAYTELLLGLAGAVAARGWHWSGRRIAQVALRRANENEEGRLQAIAHHLLVRTERYLGERAAAERHLVEATRLAGEYGMRSLRIDIDLEAASLRSSRASDDWSLSAQPDLERFTPRQLLAWHLLLLDVSQKRGPPPASVSEVERLLARGLPLLLKGWARRSLARTVSDVRRKEAMLVEAETCALFARDPGTLAATGVQLAAVHAERGMNAEALRRLDGVAHVIEGLLGECRQPGPRRRAVENGLDCREAYLSAVSSLGEAADWSRAYSFFQIFHNRTYADAALALPAHDYLPPNEQDLGSATTVRASASEVVERLAENELVVDISATRHAYVVWRVSRSGVRPPLEVPRSLLDDCLDDLDALVASHAYATARGLERARRNFDSILESVWTLLRIDEWEVVGTHRLVISPEGRTVELPLHAARNPASGDYLVDRVDSIGYTPNVTVWMDRKRRGNPRTLGLFTPAAAGLAARTREAEQLEASFTAPQVFRELEATPEAFIRVAAEVDLLYVASHGGEGAAGASAARFELSGGALDGEALKLRVRFRASSCAIFACCVLGRQHAGAAGEADGFVRALHVAGLATVVMGWWELDDDFAGVILPVVARDLSHGVDLATSVSRRMREMRRNWEHPVHSRLGSHPYIWASLSWWGQ